jgi:hypothetical protein
MGQVIGLLWGDFPWEERNRKVGKLLSMGAVGRTTTRALAAGGEVLPYRPPAPDAPATACGSVAEPTRPSGTGSSAAASCTSG